MQLYNEVDEMKHFLSNGYRRAEPATATQSGTNRPEIPSALSTEINAELLNGMKAITSQVNDLTKIVKEQQKKERCIISCQGIQVN